MNQVTNLDLNAGTQKSSLINRSGRQSAVDQIKAHLKEVKKKSKETETNGDFIGYVLFSNRISVDRFQEIFKFNKEFRTKVLAGSGTTETKPSGEITEMYVYIPQLTDFLPFPEMGTVFEFMSFLQLQETANSITREVTGVVNTIMERADNKSQEYIEPGLLPGPQNTPLGKETKKQINTKRAYDKYKSTLDVISMYPKVYKYAENTQYPGPGSAIMLHLPADQGSGMPTMGYGYFKHILSGVLNFEKDSETSRILEKIYKSNSERPNTT